MQCSISKSVFKHCHRVRDVNHPGISCKLRNIILFAATIPIQLLFEQFPKADYCQRGLFRWERSNWAGRKPGTQNVKRVENWKLRDPNFGTMAPGAPKSGFGPAVQSWSVLLFGFVMGHCCVGSGQMLYCTLSTTFC